MEKQKSLLRILIKLIAHIVALIYQNSMIAHRIELYNLKKYILIFFQDQTFSILIKNAN